VDHHRCWITLNKMNFLNDHCSVQDDFVVVVVVVVVVVDVDVVVVVVVDLRLNCQPSHPKNQYFDSILAANSNYFWSVCLRPKGISIFASEMVELGY
jgi:hypothetical protein